MNVLSVVDRLMGDVKVISNLINSEYSAIVPIK